MYRGHLEVWEVAALLDGDLPDRDLRIARRHLFECDSCEARVTEALGPPTGRDGGPADGPIDVMALDDGSRSIPDPNPSSLHHLYQRLEAERGEAETLLVQAGAEGLIASGTPAQLDRAYATWGFFERLMRETRTLLTSDPQQAQRLVQLALRVVARLDPDLYGQPRIETAKVRAWSHLGNVERILGDHPAAEKSFRRADFHYWQSELDPLDEATLLEFRSALRRTEGRFEEATELIDESIAICQEIAEPHLEGRARMARGIIFLYAGSPDAAADELSRSLAKLDRSRDPHLPVFCLLNQLLCLTEANRASEAVALLPQAKELSQTVLFGADLLRLRWIEARIEREMGGHAAAEEAFRALQSEYLEQERPVDAALVTLDLAALLVQTGRTAETRELVQEMVPVFDALQIRREVLAALVVLQQAAEAERLSLTLVRETVLRVRLGALGLAAPVQG